MQSPVTPAKAQAEPPAKPSMMDYRSDTDKRSDRSRTRRANLLVMLAAGGAIVLLGGAMVGALWPGKPGSTAGSGAPPATQSPAQNP